MTEVAGSVKQIGQGLTQTTYNYDPLDALVDIVTNAAGTLFPMRYIVARLTNICRPSCQCDQAEEVRQWRRLLICSFGFGHPNASQLAREFTLAHECFVERVSASIVK
jgi:hypothetical protein